MTIPVSVYIAFYIVGVILSFDVLTSKLKRKFPNLMYDSRMRFGVFVTCLFSFVALYFIVTNKSLNE